MHSFWLLQFSLSSSLLLNRNDWKLSLLFSISCSLSLHPNLKRYPSKTVFKPCTALWRPDDRGFWAQHHLAIVMPGDWQAASSPTCQIWSRGEGKEGPSPLTRKGSLPLMQKVISWLAEHLNHAWQTQQPQHRFGEPVQRMHCVEVASMCECRLLQQNRAVCLFSSGDTSCVFNSALNAQATVLQECHKFIPRFYFIFNWVRKKCLSELEMFRLSVKCL